MTGLDCLVAAAWLVSILAWLMMWRRNRDARRHVRALTYRVRYLEAGGR